MDNVKRRRIEKAARLANNASQAEEAESALKARAITEEDKLSPKRRKPRNRKHS